MLLSIALLSCDCQCPYSLVKNRGRSYEAAEVVADKLAVGRVAAGPVAGLVAGQEVVDSRAAVLDRIATW